MSSSSDLFVCGSSFFSSEPFSPFSDSALSINEILKTLPDDENEIDQIAAALLISSSPPNHQMSSLSVSQRPHFGNTDVNVFTGPDVKTENFHHPFKFSCDYENSFGVGECENAVKMMHRSFSFNRFEGRPSFLNHPKEFYSFNSQELNSYGNNAPVKIRRVCSTGDLQSIKAKERLSCSPLGIEKCCLQQENTKVAKYSAEERKERIERYKAKRAQRNFNKTIKYACRKTLADSRPRIRGRFARNDEAVGATKTITFNRDEDEDDSWAEGFSEGGDETRGAYFNNYASAHFQSYNIYR